MQSRKLLITLIAALTLATVQLLAPAEADLAQHYVTTLEVRHPKPGEPSKQDCPRLMKVLPEVVVTAHLNDPPATSPRVATAALPDRLGDTLARMRLLVPYYAFGRASAQ